jgi:hypothetical protein
VDQAVGERSHGRVVSDENQSGPLAAAQLGQQLEDAPAGPAIQVARGLVGKQNGRPGSEGPRQGDPLLLAAGELARVVMAAVLEAHGGEELVGAAHRIGLPEELDREEDVLARRQIGQELKALEDEADLVPAEEGELILRQVLDRPAVDPHLAGGGAVEAGHQGEEGGLAAAGGPQHGHELARLDPQVDAVDDGQHAVPRGEPAGQLSQFNAGWDRRAHHRKASHHRNRTRQEPLSFMGWRPTRCGARSQPSL